MGRPFYFSINLLGSRCMLEAELVNNLQAFKDKVEAATVFCMGEAAEQQPLAIITKVDLKWQNRINQSELKIALKKDLYYPLFKNISSLK